MATLADFRTGVTSKLGLDNTASSAEQALVDSWCNEAVVQILLRTHCTVEKGSVSTIASTWRYQLDTDILALTELYREGRSERVKRASSHQIVDYQRASPATNDTLDLHYAVEGANLLLLWPTPASVFTLDFFYVPRPTAMSSASHDPSSLTFGRIPTEFHKAIEYYALWQGAEYDESRTAQGGERFRALYEDELTKIRRAINLKGGSKLHPARLAGRRRYLISDRSQDW